MTRVDLRTSDLHRLLAPVIPHASTDKDAPNLCVVRLEALGGTLTAVATDMLCSLAATRHGPVDGLDDFTLTLRREDAVGALRTFKHTKTNDPELSLVVDEMPVPTDAASQMRLAIRIDSETGTRLAYPDVTPAEPPRVLRQWRETLAGAVQARPVSRPAPVIVLSSWAAPRWAKAPGELRMFPGEALGDLVLVTAGDSFIGLWKPLSHLKGEPEDLLAESPWVKDLASVQGLPVDEVSK
ncbi:hypothetical protein [Acrocarpospora sp. B8E8]|uniref:hypothetical protein n=1 Tax=Acrocarpospora sp. B8E8 TaxID=3153572 RepID=UPI00325F113D